MNRYLLYDEIIAGGDRIGADPIAHLEPGQGQQHVQVDIRIDRYDHADLFHDLLDRHGLAAAGPARGAVETLDDLLALSGSSDPAALRARLDLLSDADLGDIGAEIRQRIGLLAGEHDLAMMAGLIPTDILQRSESGRDPFLSIIRMAMFSCGDLEPICNAAAVIIGDYLQLMLSEAVSHLPRPIHYSHVQSQFPRQAAMFNRWWAAKQQSRAAAAPSPSSSDTASDYDDMETTSHDMDEIGPRSDQSQSSFQIERYIDLDQDRSAESSSGLYEIDAPAAANFKIGPRVRQNQARIREQTMSLDEYQYYCRCRQASFVGRANRAKFLSWISLDRTQIIPDCAERVIGLLGLIAHDHIGAIVELGKGLQQAHAAPLTFSQVQDALTSVKLLQYDIGPRTGLLQILTASPPTHTHN